MRHSGRDKTRRLLGRLGDELFPDRYTCIVCGAELFTASREGTCPTCSGLLPLIQHPYCLKCGKPILPPDTVLPAAADVADPEQQWVTGWEDEPPLVDVPDGTYCHLCRCTRRHFAMARSAFAYTGMARRLIYRMKFGDKGYIGRYLSAYLADVYINEGWEADLVVAVPLHWTRRLQRGYNQAAIVAAHFADRLQLPYAPKAVRKVRRTLPQTHLDTKARRINLHGAFAVDRGQVQGKIVLVVDDVLTTGSTMDEMARCLLAAGAKRVLGLTVANVPEH